MLSSVNLEKINRMADARYSRCKIRCLIKEVKPINFVKNVV